MARHGAGVLAILNGVLALGLELAALYLFFRAGPLMGPGRAGVATGLALAAGLAAVWGRWIAPKAARRLSGLALLGAKATVFALAAVAAGVLLGPWPAAGLAVVAAFQLALALGIGAL